MTYDVVRTVLLLILLATAAICDIRTGKIYNWLTYPATLAGFGLAWWFEGWEGMGAAAAGAAVGFVPMFLAFVAGGMGGGDAKLMAGVGSLALFDLALHTFVYGLIAGAAMAVVAMIWTGRVRATMERVMRALGLAMMGRKPADPTPADSPKVRLGAAFCVGGCWALLEAALGRSLWDTLAGFAG